MKESRQRVSHHAQTRARRTALQALYQWDLGKQDLADIEAQFREAQDMRKVDTDYFRELLHHIVRASKSWTAEWLPFWTDQSDNSIRSSGPSCV